MLHAHAALAISSAPSVESNVFKANTDLFPGLRMLNPTPGRNSMAEDRRFERHGSTLETGKVLFGDPQDFCDCLVWDLGRSAATIEIGPDTALPAAFRLVSEGLRLDERCLVIWREDRKLGLKFAS
jgi:hypothetical protein